jgi:hypothetical protein
MIARGGGGTCGRSRSRQRGDGVVVKQEPGGEENWLCEREEGGTRRALGLSTF